MLSPIVIPTEALALAKTGLASVLSVVCREPETVVVVAFEMTSTVPGAPYTRVAMFPMYLAVWVVE